MATRSVALRRPIRRGVSTVPMLLTLERDGATPLHRQIYLALRAAVLEGRLSAGSRLPSSRVLADDLHVSRTTVLGAYDQLAAEGFIVTQGGGGSRVAGAAPKLSSSARPARGKTAAAEVSALAARMLATYRPFAEPADAGLGATLARRRGCRPLALGIPALDAFPVATWARLTNRCWRRHATDLLLPDDGPGYLPLREAIAEYVLTARAVRCTADQVIITAGAQQGIDVTARLLLNPGDQVWMEEPGYVLARAAFLGVGARLVEVPVDQEGLDVAYGAARAPKARLAFVTPSYQAPLGVTMSLRRRLALLDWATEQRSWIVEDDYNGEFRYDGQPLASMQGLDHPGTRRVIFLGTFSKTLFPALRLGYAIVPPELVDAFTLARVTADRHSPVLEQAVLADFIAEGHFARHVRRMRTLYAERQGVFVALARREVGSLMQVDPAPAGMRLLGWLPEGVSDQQVAREAARRGVIVEPLSRHRVTPSSADALILGYAPFSAAEARRALRTIGDTIRAVMS